jgi:hypothetical protein
MSYDNDRIVFYTEIITQWGATTPILFDSVSDDEPITKGNDPWIHCNIVPLTTKQKSLGTSTSVLYRTPGLFTIDIYDRVNNGIAEILRLADKVKGIFLGKAFDSSMILVNGVSVDRREEYNGWNSRRVNIHFESNEKVDR